MEPSILNSVKKTLGLDADYTPFDQDIILYINGAFSKLHQLGVGPTEGFWIEDETAEWSDFVVTSTSQLHLVKTFIYLSVRILFDPPTMGYLVESMNAQLREYEWRLSTMREMTDYPYVEEVVVEEV